MRSCIYIFQYDALEVAGLASDALVIEENILAVLCQILENSKRPRNIGAPIADENGFFDLFHTLERYRIRRFAERRVRSYSGKDENSKFQRRNLFGPQCI